MTTRPPVSRLDARLDAAAGPAAVAVGVLWLAVAGTIAVVVRLGTPDPAELLGDVADRPALWIGANAALIVQQAVLVVALPAVIALTGQAAAGAVARGLLAMSGAALVASGVVHGVFGAHLASKVGDRPLPAELVADAELVHAIADTWWFVGVAAMTAATAMVTVAVWSPRPALARLGAAAVAANLLQFGWFVDHGFAVFAAAGTALQAAWFAAVGVTHGRDAATSSHPR